MVSRTTYFDLIPIISSFLKHIKVTKNRYHLSQYIDTINWISILNGVRWWNRSNTISQKTANAGVIASDKSPLRIIWLAGNSTTMKIANHSSKFKADYPASTDNFQPQNRHSIISRLKLNWWFWKILKYNSKRRWVMPVLLIESCIHKMWFFYNF